MFSPALNVVQVLASLVFVHVVQHCSATTLSKIGYPAQNFARAAFLWRRKIKREQASGDRSYGSDMVMTCSVNVHPATWSHFLAKKRIYLPKTLKKGILGVPEAKKGNLGGPGGLQAAYCSRKSLTLSCCCSQILLLFCCYCSAAEQCSALNVTQL